VDVVLAVGDRLRGRREQAGLRRAGLGLNARADAEASTIASSSCRQPGRPWRPTGGKYVPA
jgi:hypothetical protein